MANQPPDLASSEPGGAAREMTRLPSHCASVRVLLPKPAVGVSAESEEDDAMAVSWRVSGRVLVVTEAGVNANHEIERAFVVEALADSRCRRGARVLWDSRTSEAALSAEDMEWRVNYLRSLAEQGVLARFALLARESQGVTIELARSEVPKAVAPLQYSVFTDEAQALSWLEA